MKLVANVELILISEMTLDGKLQHCFNQNFYHFNRWGRLVRLQGQ